MAVPKTEQETAIENLRKMLKPGDTIHTVLSSESRSGMSRVIRFLILKPNKKSPNGVQVLEPTYEISTALDYRMAKNHDGLVVGGCGMNMGFHVVYRLGQALWPNGTRNGEPDFNGGYALKQRWL